MYMLYILCAYSMSGDLVEQRMTQKPILKERGLSLGYQEVGPLGHS